MSCGITTWEEFVLKNRDLSGVPPRQTTGDSRNWDRSVAYMDETRRLSKLWREHQGKASPKRRRLPRNVTPIRQED